MAVIGTDEAIRARKAGVVATVMDLHRCSLIWIRPGPATSLKTTSSRRSVRGRDYDAVAGLPVQQQIRGLKELCSDRVTPLITRGQFTGNSFAAANCLWNRRQANFSDQMTRNCSAAANAAQSYSSSICLNARRGVVDEQLRLLSGPCLFVTFKISLKLSQQKRAPLSKSTAINLRYNGQDATNNQTRLTSTFASPHVSTGSCFGKPSISLPDQKKSIVQTPPSSSFSGCCTNQ